MTTLVQSLFYLWLVVSVLLVVMWFLRRQDRRRDHIPDPDTLLPGFDGPVLEISPPSEGSPSSAPTPPVSADAPDEIVVADHAVATEPERAVAQGGGPESEPTKTTAAGQKKKSAGRQKKASGNQTTSTTDSSGEPGRGSKVKKPIEAVRGNADDIDHEAESATEANADTAEASNGNRSSRTAKGGRSKRRSSAKARTPSATIDDLLDGITLPYELTPLPSEVDDPTCHLVLLTSHDDPAAVGTAFADQLVDLGYQIEPAGHDRAVARRNGEVLTMRIAANAGAAEGDRAPRFPTASASDVAIEVWAGTGPSPKSTD